ncbi:hypothetical protein GRF29_216g116588 [Pseudopithomyces chartarum]|uniref:Uncharacterized protein n=1 Tax=Pseudopithomyces chartarum TaxID=1892770 RepID=A0AAN6LM63_9PLEO|nr:hypothetical protein GRF29_216g116588 [Pseudopithomyces chartarum]
MPRQVAPPPSDEFQVVLAKPFSGTPTLQIEVIGEKNRSASIRRTESNGSGSSSEKKGDVPQDDVKELLSLVSQLRGFPSHPSKDVYGLDVKVDFNTFDIQWSNADDDSVVDEIAGEQKDDFKRITDSIEALSRTFAKQNSAV